MKTHKAVHKVYGCLGVILQIVQVIPSSAALYTTVVGEMTARVCADADEAGAHARVEDSANHDPNVIIDLRRLFNVYITS